MSFELNVHKRTSDKDALLEVERRLWSSGIRWVAGIDEAGRGPLAGPVVSAAVVFDCEVFVEGVRDSKTLLPELREILYDQIRQSASAIGVGVVDHDMIDEINILQATYRSMHRAVEALTVHPQHQLVDGNRFLGNGIPFTTIVDGDALCFSIAAASIIAKVTRDRIMLELDRQYPEYGFARNKGYATREHRDAILTHGYSPVHRRSFVLRNQLELEFADDALIPAD